MQCILIRIELSVFIFGFFGMCLGLIFARIVTVLERNVRTDQYLIATVDRCTEGPRPDNDSFRLVLAEPEHETIVTQR